MSKSKGNVLYPQDLLAKGYKNEHIRFFLIYGSYRQRRNFTWENLAETSRLLDDFKTAVRNLQEANAQSSSPKAKVLAHSIAVTFSRYMDDDLDVKGAFDALHDTFSGLHGFIQADKLSRKDAQAALTELKEVDRVLQIIF